MRERAVKARKSGWRTVQSARLWLIKSVWWRVDVSGRPARQTRTETSSSRDKRTNKNDRERDILFFCTSCVLRPPGRSVVVLSGSHSDQPRARKEHARRVMSGQDAKVPGEATRHTGTQRIRQLVPERCSSLPAGRGNAPGSSRGGRLPGAYATDRGLGLSSGP